MLANISHDIKTPLTVILGYLEIMRLNHADNEMLKKVETKANQVMNLINQFFTLAKLESGDTNINLGKVNINEICRENVLEFYDILLQKDFDVDLFIPETAIFVQGDKEALQRILYNLLSNVIRYGSDGKYLGVFCVRTRAMYRQHTECQNNFYSKVEKNNLLNSLRNTLRVSLYAQKAWAGIMKEIRKN